MHKHKEKSKEIIATDESNEIGLIDLATENPNFKYQIASLTAKLEANNDSDIEEEVAVLLGNMMNFFARFVKDIPSFDSLTPNQKKILLLKFKELAHSLAGRKIKSIDEIAQVFVFTILSSIGENIAGARDLTAIEIMNKKHKHNFREFLKHAASYEAYKIINPRQIAGETKEENFIANAVVLGVKKAMEYAGVDFDNKKIDQSSLKILEAAHASFLRHKKGITKSMGISF